VISWLDSKGRGSAAAAAAAAGRPSSRPASRQPGGLHAAARQALLPVVAACASAPRLPPCLTKI